MWMSRSKPGTATPDWPGAQRYRPVSRHHTANTIETRCGMQIFAAHFQVMPSERGREVIPNGLRVLQDVQRAGSDRVPAQHDNDGTSVQHRVIWKVLALPSDCRLVLPLVIGKPAF